MRRVVYDQVVKLPFKAGSGLGWILGLLSAVFPAKVQQIAGDAVSASAIHTTGITLLALSSIYFMLLWLLKPSTADLSSPGLHVSGGNVTFNYYGSVVREEVALFDPIGAESTNLPPVVISTSSAATTTLSDTVPASQIFPPTVRAISPLHTGRILISASRLASENLLEVSIAAINGSAETVAVDEVVGTLDAGILNGSYSRLPPPIWNVDKNAAAIPAGSDFFVVFNQPVPAELAVSFTNALERGDTIGFDFHEIKVVLRSLDHPELIAPLTLWDGATIRRGNDVSTGRIITATGHATLRAQPSLSMVVTRAEGTTDERNT